MPVAPGRESLADASGWDGLIMKPSLADASGYQINVPKASGYQDIVSQALPKILRSIATDPAKSEEIE